MSQPAVAVSATPDAVESAPRTVAVRSPQRGAASSSPVATGTVTGAVPGAGWRHTTSFAPARLSCAATPAPGTADRSTTRSAAASTAGRWATTSTRLVRASVDMVSSRTCSVSSSRWALGSSRSTTGRAASTTRARATRARCPADSPAPSSPRGVPKPSGKLRTTSASPTRSSASHTSSSSAAGVPIRTLAAMVSATSQGRCGAQATWARHHPGSTSPRGVPPTRTSPRIGGSSPRRVASRVDFPQPDVPATATRPRSGRSRSRGRVRGEPGSYPIPSCDSASRTEPGWVLPGRSVEARASSSSASASAAVPSAAAWNSAPTRRRGQ